MKKNTFNIRKKIYFCYNSITLFSPPVITQPPKHPEAYILEIFMIQFLVASTFVSYPPQTLPCVTELSNGSFPPPRRCQPVAGQQWSHLSPLQHAENNLGCVRVHVNGCVSARVVTGGQS